MSILQAISDIGLLRDINEDYAFCNSHPKNPNVKFLVLADGMGGKEHGEFASNFVVEKLKNWFIEKDAKTLNDVKQTRDLLIKYIKRLNTEIIKKCGNNRSGTTLTMSILGKRKTIIANVGDSRAYIYKDQELIQVTEDDSDVWMYYKYGEVKKDDLRYFSNNNIVTACVGICKELCTVSTTIIDNDYDILILLSDGVTDIITDSKIKSLIRKTPSTFLLDSIIEEAVYIDQNLKVPKRLKRKFLANYIVPFKGRDNASGAIYIKEV